jgi:uncharacterized Zn finger protein (UPF0148 family)
MSKELYTILCSECGSPIIRKNKTKRTLCNKHLWKYYRTTGKYKESHSKHYKANKELIRAKSAQWSKNNRLKRKEFDTIYIHKSIEELKDSYIRKMIYHDFGLKANQVPQEVLDLKRAIIKLKRLCKQ